MDTALTAVNKLDRATSAPNGAGGTHASPLSINRSSAPESAPADLMHFVCWSNAGDVARELGIGRGTVYRLAKGYWPADPSKILQAWGRYKASRSMLDSSWFLRRVRVGGVVRHAGADFTAPGLPARVGQMLAVARATDGSLLAQTLELPAERIALMQTPATQH